MPSNFNHVLFFCFQSSLLNAILGELPALSGEVIAHGQVTYAAQTPWVFSGTVRDNILFGEVFDSKKYKNVISACCLTKVSCP